MKILQSKASTCNLQRAITHRFIHQFSEQIPQQKTLQASISQNFQSQSAQKQSSYFTKKELLSEVLRQVNLREQKSILLNDEDEDESKRRKLSASQKSKIGVFLPSHPVSTRMGFPIQSQYRQALCQNLYFHQQNNLPTGVRILESEQSPSSQALTMEKYVNIIYKDIYSRYLISKGVGVAWNSQYSSYGVLNPAHKQPLPKEAVLDFIQKSLPHLETKQIIAPYSYFTSQFIGIDQVEVENIRKMAHYLKLPLVGYAKHQTQFSKLIEQGHSVKLLVVCEYGHKLIKPNCLCMSPGKMAILKRYIPDTVYEKQHGSLRTQYLITSIDTFNRHKAELHNRQKYQVHSVFQSKYLVGMQAYYGLESDAIQFRNQSKNKPEGSLSPTDNTKILSIKEDIPGYQRDPNVYIVDGSHSIGDYERVSSYEMLDSVSNLFNSQGFIYNPKYGDRNTLSTLDCSIKENITDLQFEQKIIESLRPFLEFEDIYEVFEDQAYMHRSSGELLHFRLQQKVYIPIPSKSYELFDRFLSDQRQVYIHESKIQIPQARTIKRPKDRRQHRKLVRKLIEQKTSYMTLRESINSLNNIPVLDVKKLGYAVKVIRDKQSGKIKGISSDMGMVQKPGQVHDNLEAVEMHVCPSLVSSLSFIQYLKSHPQESTKCSEQSPQPLPCVIIQPQNSAEDLIALSMHTHMFISLQLLNRTNSASKRGRQTNLRSSVRKNDDLAELSNVYKVIYLHPTISSQINQQANVKNFIEGSLKIVQKKFYGYGYEAIRLWVCRHAQNLGDRSLSESEVNQELQNGTFIRKLYDQLLPFLSLPQTGSSNSEEFSAEEESKQRLPLLQGFIMDHIDMFILNMEYFFSKLMIHEAYNYMGEFYRLIVDEVFVQTVREQMITYPLLETNRHNRVVIKRLLSCLSIVNVLMPFTAYHILKMPLIEWPKVHNPHCLEKQPEYNRMLRIRNELRNKLYINNFNNDNAEIVWSLEGCEYSLEELRDFFGVRKVVLKQPNVDHRSFSLKIEKETTLGTKGKVKVFEYHDTCVRCDTKSKQKEYLCGECVRYLEEFVGQTLPNSEHTVPEQIPLSAETQELSEKQQKLHSVNHLL